MRLRNNFAVLMLLCATVLTISLVHGKEGTVTNVTTPSNSSATVAWTEDALGFSTTAVCPTGTTFKIAITSMPNSVGPGDLSFGLVANRYSAFTVKDAESIWSLQGPQQIEQFTLPRSSRVILMLGQYGQPSKLSKKQVFDNCDPSSQRLLADGVVELQFQLPQPANRDNNQPPPNKEVVVVQVKSKPAEF